MPRALLAVVLIGLGDSLNPTTLGPAMYLTTVEHARRALAEFLVGLLAVNIGAGVLILLGPGELLLSLLPKPDTTAKAIIELVAGIGLIVIGVLLWAGRRALGRRKPPTYKPGGRSGVMLGAAIALVELPTAVPYFAAIAVIIGSGVALPGKVVLLVAYNVAFVAPILAVLVTMLVVGDRARPFLERANDWMLGHWPGIIASIAGLLGFVIAGLGVAGLLGA